MSKPTQYQLAKIAAALDEGGNGDPGIVAQRALWLWDACETVLKRRDEIEQLREDRLKEYTGPLEGIKIPSGPVTLEKFLRLTLHKKGVPERMKIFRDYLNYALPIDHMIEAGRPGEMRPEDLEEMVEREIEKARKTGFPDGRFAGNARRFLRWFAGYEEQKIKDATSTAGKASAKKKAARKAKTAKRPTQKKTATVRKKTP